MRKQVGDCPHLSSVLSVSFSASTLLNGQQGGHSKLVKPCLAINEKAYARNVDKN